ncbi:MAG: RNA polymerase sigma factor region1.1 domain-containing protein, partial [Mesotoga sp.]
MEKQKRKTRTKAKVIEENIKSLAEKIVVEETDSDDNGENNVLITKEEIDKRIKKLLRQGKKKGFITYEDIDSAFPPDYEGFDSTLVESIYEEFEKNKINIV